MDAARRAIRFRTSWICAPRSSSSNAVPCLTTSGFRRIATPAIQDEIEDSGTHVRIHTVQSAHDAAENSSLGAQGKSKPVKKPRRTKKQLAALEKMQRLAEQIRAEQQITHLPAAGAASNSSEAVELHAPEDATFTPSASSHSEPASAGPSVPTLETLKSYQPKRAPNLWSDRYPKQYQRVFGRLDNAFVKEQMSFLARELLAREQAEQESRNAMDSDLLRHAEGSDDFDWSRFSKATLASPSSTPGFLRASLAPINVKRHSKRHIIERVLDVWGWKKPEVIAREKKKQALQNQVESRAFPVTEAEAYLFFKRGASSSSMIAPCADSFRRSRLRPRPDLPTRLRAEHRTISSIGDQGDGQGASFRSSTQSIGRQEKSEPYRTACKAEIRV